MIVLDLGSGNTCRNDLGKVKDMIDAVYDGKRDAVIKWQLFQTAPPNEPLKRDVFRYAYEYAAELGIKTTASFFDYDSLEFLMGFDVPFFKIANRPELYPMAAGIHDVPIWVSYASDVEMGKRALVKPLCCVSRYPAQIVEYEKHFAPRWLAEGISDHTVGLDLYHKYQPERFEKHFVLKHDKSNPDAGLFAITPKELIEL